MIKFNIPYWILSNISSISPIISFGAYGFFLNLVPCKDILSSCSLQFFFLGYSLVQTGFHCYSPSLC